MPHKPEHRKQLDYVRHEDTCLNKSYHSEYQSNGMPKTLANYLADAKKRVKALTGRSMQKTAEDRAIGEAIVVIDEDTTMDDLHRLSDRMHSAFGWNALQIHIHRDEGHYSDNPFPYDGWKQNLHAHIFFDLTDRKTGKSWKPKHEDWSRMQDITAEALKMNRGIPYSKTGKKHLNAVDYKLKQKSDELEKISDKVSRIEEVIEQKEERKKTLQAEIEKKEEATKKLQGMIEEGLGVIKSQEQKLLEIKSVAKEKIEEAEKKAMMDFSKASYVLKVMENAHKCAKIDFDDLKAQYTSRNLLGVSKVDYERFTEELERKHISMTEALKGETQKMLLYSRKLEDQRREGREQIENLNRELEALKAAILNALGHLFRRFWEEVRLFREVIISFKQALEMWGGKQYLWNGKSISADGKEGALLIDHRRVFLIEKREQELLQKRKRGLTL